MTTELDTQTRGHHPHSPSSLQNSEACPHFVNHQSDSAASQAGVLQHKAAETRDLSILNGNAEQEEAVTRYIEQEDGWIAALRDAGAVSVEVIREQYLAVGGDVVLDEHGNPWTGITGGYPDLALIGTSNDGTAIGVIVDAKFGKLLVTPTKANLQGRAYALALMLKYPQVLEVHVQFHHPYIEKEQPDPAFTYTFTREDAASMEEHIRYVVARKLRAQSEGLHSLTVSPTPKTGLCQWCANFAVCPAVGKLLAPTVSKFEPLTLSVPHIELAEVKTPEQASHLYRVANVLELFCKAAKKRVNELATTEQKLGDSEWLEELSAHGYKLTTRKERTVVDPALAFETAQKHGLTVSDWYSCTNVPITKLESLLKERAKKGHGAGAVRAFLEDLDEVGAVSLSSGFSFLQEIKKKTLTVDV